MGLCRSLFSNNSFGKLVFRLTGLSLFFVCFKSNVLNQDESYSSFESYLCYYYSKGVKGESHIDFRTQCVIMTLGVGEAITNVVVKFTKNIEFQSS